MNNRLVIIRGRSIWIEVGQWYLAPYLSPAYVNDSILCIYLSENWEDIVSVSLNAAVGLMLLWSGTQIRSSFWFFCQKADEVPPGMLFVNAGRADVETRTGSDRKLKANLQGRMDGLC